MKRDATADKKLIDFCSRLPVIAGEPAAAETETRWVLAQFLQRRQELQLVLGSSATPAHEAPALRCEISALDAASSVLTQLWQRRFGAPLNFG